MPAVHRSDPVLPEAVAAALTRASRAAAETSHELMSHFIDTGSAPTQRAVDILVDSAADALQVLTDSLADFSLELGRAAFDEGAADGVSARPARRWDRGP